MVELGFNENEEQKVNTLSVMEKKILFANLNCEIIIFFPTMKEKAKRLL